jgi:uncharacterized coiled-coil protein SlyX
MDATDATELATDARIRHLHRQVAERDGSIRWLHQQVAEHDRWIAWLHARIAELDARIRQLGEAAPGGERDG